MFVVIILVLLYSLLISTTNALSACDEIDVTFILDIDTIVNAEDDLILNL